MKCSPLIRFSLSILFLLALITGCQKKESGGVSIKARSSSLGPEAGSTFVSVTATLDWTITLEFPGGTSWASIDPASGTGSKSDILLKYEANTSEEDREVVLVLNGMGAEDRTSLIQYGKGGGAKGKYGYDTLPSALDWLELPATTASDGREVLIHRFSDNSRNWSCYWDYSNYVSVWVAYPLNKSLIGSYVARSEAWGYDPVFGSNYGVQQNISGGYQEGNNGWYARGHQIPSADRLGTTARNATTYYGTNMTPQNNTFNGGIWATLEGKVRGFSSSCDTLYVVTGCLLEGSKYYALDRSGHKLTVPTYYFKALLAHTVGTTQGQEGYLAAGYLLPHSAALPNTDQELAKYLMSIDKLEEQTGFDFFPNLSRKIGKDKADLVESTTPGNWWK